MRVWIRAGTESRPTVERHERERERDIKSDRRYSTNRRESTNKTKRNQGEDSSAGLVCRNQRCWRLTAHAPRAAEAAGAASAMHARPAAPWRRQTTAL